MKTKYAMVMLALGMSSAVLAQENDDMYFNSKDRAVLNQANQVVLAKKYKQDDLNAVRSNPVNPSDSYSGRGVNPEYNSQSKNGTTVENPDYFITGYQPKNVNGKLYNGNASSYSNPYNCNCNNYLSPYAMGGYGMSGFGSPFYSPYSSFYSPYSSPYSPFSSMFGMGMSSGFYSGFSYGIGSMWGSPYNMYGMYGMNSFYNPYGYGNAGYYGYPYNNNIIVLNGDATRTVNGRHPSRSTNANNFYDNTTNNSTIVGTNGRVREGGRMRTDSQPNYYDAGWRNNADNFPSRSGFSGSGGRSSSWGTSGTSWDNNSGGRTRSGWGDSMGGGSRSFGSGGASGGSSGGGHSRGRQ